MKYRLLFLLAASIGLSGCDDEVVCEQTDEFVDPVEDMVGYINTNMTTDGLGTLFVREAFLPEVLDELGAVQVDGDIHVMNTMLPDGTEEEFRFRPNFTETPYIFSTGDDLPDEIRSKFQVFINAECKRVADAVSFPCEKYLDIFIELEGRQQDRCKRGTSICTEVSQITAIRYEYEDSLCTVLIQIVTEKDWDCQ